MPLELTETILLSVEGFDVTIGCSALSPSSALTSGSLPSAPSGIARERDDRPGVTPIVNFRTPRFIRDRRFRNRLDVRRLIRQILRNKLGNNNRPRRPPTPPPPTSPPPMFPPPPAPVDTRSCLVTRTTPSGGFRINTTGGANALALDNIIFSDAVDVMSSTTDVVPLVESAPDALGSGSNVRVDTCEFRNFVNGTFVIGSFSSDASFDGSSVFDVRLSAFVNNTGSDSRSGAIDIDSSANSIISIVASEFSSNNSTGLGGAVRLIAGSIFDGPSSVFIESTLFRMNTGGIFGGALFVDGLFAPNSTVDIQNSIFTGNEVTFFGGGFYIQNVGAVGIQNSSFTGNTAAGAGAVEFLAVDSIDIHDSTFTDNIATDNDGGAVLVFSCGDVLVANSNFTNNIAEGIQGVTTVGRGGAVSFFNTENATNIENSSFTNNTSLEESGGAIFYFIGGSLDIRDSTFTNNSALLDGGAVSNRGGSSLGIHDSAFVSNTAFSAGGAVNAEFLGFSAPARFTCVRAGFIDNFAARGGGGVRTLNVGPVNFTANVFVQNEAGEEGGAFRCEDTFGSNPFFTNVSNVFFDNTAPAFPSGLADGFSNTS